MTTIFNKKYDSESMVDMNRDISEAFDTEYNETLTEELREDQSVQVIFTFENKKKSVLLDKTYDVMSMNDIEENIDDTIRNIQSTGDVEMDEHGFFNGELTLIIKLVDE